MKNYFIKMILIVLTISSIIYIYKEKTVKTIAQNTVANNMVLQSGISYNRYELEIVYDGLTIKELGQKIDKYMNSNLDNYGEIIASRALEKGVDPVIAASIILVETGCQSNCSTLVKKCNNIGGMKGKGGCGSYAKFSSLDAGIDAFINNLSKNYFAIGLTTPATINKKYAENPNWHKDVNYYVKKIKAS